MSAEPAAAPIPADAPADEPIQFEIIAESTDLVDLAYQPVCRVACADGAS
jgi:hypothetical protein